MTATKPIELLPIPVLRTGQVQVRDFSLDEVQDYARANVADCLARQTPLTEDEVHSIVLKINGRPPTSLQIARAIEAAYGVGLTPEQLRGEPADTPVQASSLQAEGWDG